MLPPSSPLAHSHPLILFYRFVENQPHDDVNDSSNLGYGFAVAASVGVMYDWVLTFGQEVELIWRQRWSLMTVLYLGVRYGGIGFSVMYMLGLVVYDALNWTNDVVEVILGVIMIARLHAMYQRSRKVLIFLVVSLLAITIANAVMGVIMMLRISGEEYILSGTYQCSIGYAGDSIFLGSMTWILGTVWEVLALCLAVWIAIKHFRELRRHSTSGIIRDCFTVLMQTHVSYFASFLVISCFEIGLFSPTLSADVLSLDTQIYIGLRQIFQVVQMFVLGPRLILGVREYHAKLVANSDTASAMSSVAFQEQVHVSTSNSV
ncbi:hypothetical protein DFJ58DRAFT_750188 [Suillus subalutaceus]|uniref:uncharacterized protein n=1 Tax=Suillus subalutaceus TaxID=48586 RepID=UPI001B87FACE|nr:uncharacterized protein DFJ58DRAFT_750188 [Suillus subalutaceus]KAG1834335.1 hypothetical protein DFJ58DRAFT_750188 [Suillus subalutaceus]